MNQIYLVDGQKAMSQVLAESLATRQYEVVGSSTTIQEAMEEVVTLRPQLILLEMLLPDGPGYKLVERLRTALPKARFLIFSDDKNPTNIKASLQVGVHGFVEKSVDLGMVLNALKIVKEGGCFFGFNITEVLRTVVSDGPEPKVKQDNLTEREREVLCLIAEGNSNRDIAALLNLSIKTVDNHRCSMMRKLDVHNVAAITRYAVEHRLVKVEFQA